MATAERLLALRDRTVVHLSYADLSARLALIARYLPGLQSESPLRRFFFVDVPVGTTSGLEVVQLHMPTDRLARSDLSDWLAVCRANNLITAASFAAAPLVLNPAFFPRRRVPPFYLQAMADCSARAATLLAHSGGPAPEDTVSSEIAALYTAYFPRRSNRRGALELYAAWLEHTATGSVAPTPTRVDRQTVQWGLVARLAHTQAVRLRGPDYPGGLMREAALVRRLLRTETEPATWSPTETGT